MKNFKLLICLIISIVLLAVVTPAKIPPDIIVQLNLDNNSKAFPAVILQSEVKSPDLLKTAVSPTNDWLNENNSNKRAKKVKFSELYDAHNFKPTNIFSPEPAIVRLE